MLQVNSKVIIKTDLISDKKYNDIYCHYGMLKFSGKEMTIGDFPFENNKNVFYLKEDLEGHLWFTSMLEK